MSVGTAALSWGYGDVAIGTDTVAVSQPPLGSYSAATAVGYTDQTINGLRKEYSRAIAAVAASPALPALAPGERAIAVGTGYYNGQGGLGIAFAQALQSGAIINAGVATTGSGGKPVLRAGAAWKF